MRIETGGLQGTSGTLLRRPDCRKQRGQTLLEVALLTPMLLLLLLGVIEMGRYAYISILVGNAARAGAAYGAQSRPQSALATDICHAASDDFQGTDVPCTGGTQSVGPNGTITVTSSTSCGCDSAGTVATAGCITATNPTAGTCPGGGRWVVFVSVTASGTFSGLFNYPGIPSSINLSRTATLIVANN